MIDCTLALKLLSPDEPCGRCAAPAREHQFYARRAVDEPADPEDPIPVNRDRAALAEALNVSIAAVTRAEIAERRCVELELALDVARREIEQRPQISPEMADAFLVARDSHPHWPRHIPRAMAVVLATFRIHRIKSVRR